MNNDGDFANNEYHSAVKHINDIQEFKETFASQVSKGAKRNFSKSVYNVNDNHIEAEVMDHVWGDKSGTSLSPEAMEYIKKAFPLKIHSIQEKGEIIIDKDIVIGPKGRPYLIDVEHLIFKGGSITCISTVMTIKADKITVLTETKGNLGGKNYTIGILGTQGGNGEDGKHGRNYGHPAQAGHDSSEPTPGICTGAEEGGTGGNGLGGEVGGTGGDGSNGYPSFPATMSFNEVGENSSSIVIYTQSGEGGNGGNGGNGGKGQDGGRGGNGCDSVCEGTDGGNGGNGGIGGDGGDGGIGGSGVDGNTIIINFPKASKEYLKLISSAAKKGKGGGRGNGGEGGEGGKGGIGGRHSTNGSRGTDGKYGAYGKQGMDGRSDGSSGQFDVRYI